MPLVYWLLGSMVLVDIVFVRAATSDVSRSWRLNIGQK